MKEKNCMFKIGARVKVIDRFSKYFGLNGFVTIVDTFSIFIELKEGRGWFDNKSVASNPLKSNKFISIRRPNLMVINIKCECGAEFLGYTTHSSWCSKY